MAIRIRVKSDIAVTGGTSAITAANLGGVGLYSSKVGSILQFKGLVAGDNIVLTESATGVTIASSGGTSGVSEATFSTYTGTTAPAEFAPISVVDDYVSGATSMAGEAIYVDKLGNNLRFKGLIAGSNVTLTPSASGITIASTGGGGGGGANWGEIGGTLSDQTDLQTALNGKVDDATLTTYTGTTAPAQFVNKTLFNSYSGSTKTSIDSKLATSAFNTYSGSTASAIAAKLATSAFNTYSGATATSTANSLALKLDKSAFNTYSGSTKTSIDSKLATSAFNTYSGVTATAIAAKLSKSDFNTYSGATATSTANSLALKLDKSAFNTYSGSTKTSIDSKLATSAFNTYSGSTQNILDAAVTGGTNLGSGVATYSSKSGRNLQFKTVTVGENLAVSGNTNNVHIEFTGSTGGGGSVDATIVALSTDTTIDATYAGKIIECTGTFTLTLPNSMNTGMQVTIVNVSTGVITLAASTTLSTLDSRTKIRFQNSAVTAYHRGSNVWMAFGNLTD